MKLLIVVDNLENCKSDHFWSSRIQHPKIIQSIQEPHMNLLLLISTKSVHKQVSNSIKSSSYKSEEETEEIRNRSWTY
jgi:hypothetical protein